MKIFNMQHHRHHGCTGTMDVYCMIVWVCWLYLFRANVAEKVAVRDMLLNDGQAKLFAEADLGCWLARSWCGCLCRGLCSGGLWWDA